MKLDFKIILVTDRHQTNGRDLHNVINDAIKGGIKAVQIREKDMLDRELLSLAKDIRKITRDKGSFLFINDRADIAKIVDADGIHLGQNSYSVKDARSILGNEKIVGVSTHSLNEAIEAEDNRADFIILGPIFYTPSKVRYGEPIGTEVIRKVRSKINTPIFAIGGIKRGNINEVLNAGADGVALISAIISAPDVYKSAYELIEEIKILKQN